MPWRTFLSELGDMRVSLTEDAGKTAVVYTAKGVTWTQHLEGAKWTAKAMAPDGRWIVVAVESGIHVLDSTGKTLWTGKEQAGFDPTYRMESVNRGTHLFADFGTHDFSGKRAAVLVDLTANPPKETWLPIGTLYTVSAYSDLMAVENWGQVQTLRLGRPVASLGTEGASVVGITDDGHTIVTSRKPVGTSDDRTILEAWTPEGKLQWKVELPARVMSKMAPGKPAIWSASMQPAGGVFSFWLVDGNGKIASQLQVDQALEPVIQGVSRDGSGLFLDVRRPDLVACILTSAGAVKRCLSGIGLSLDSRTVEWGDATTKYLLPVSELLK